MLIYTKTKLIKLAVGYTGSFLAYFEIFMVSKNLVMYYGVNKGELNFFLEKVKNSECSALLNE